MFVFGDRVVCTAADLVRAARCEFAVLRALDVDLGTLAGPDVPVPTPATEVAAPGWRARFGGAIESGRTESVEIARDGIDSDDPSVRVAALTAAHEATVAALRSGASRVFGAVFFDGEFTCSCEVLVAESDRYVPHGVATDAHDVVATALELAACAAADEAVGALREPAVVRVLVGDNVSEVPLRDLLPVYRARRRRLERIVADTLGELLPVQWGDPRFLACGNCPTCVAALTAARDVLLVAGLGNPARTRLREAGITTIDRLARAGSAVPGLAVRTVTALRRQAEIQLDSERSGVPRHTVLAPRALAALPAPAPGDVALTLDSRPGRTPALTVGDADRVLIHGGGDGRAEGPLRVLEFLARRRRDHPDMRVYYYTSRVRDALLDYTGGYGLGEEILDELLCEGVLVDLYPILRSALILGERSYAPAAIRAVLSAGRPVSGDAADEVTASRTDDGSTDSAATEPDCVTLLRLRSWLAERAAEAGVFPERPGTPGTVDHQQVPLSRPSSVEAALAEFVARAGDDAPRAAKLMAAALGYHRRERQPLWWAHADRLSLPVDEWPEAPGVLVAEWGNVDTKWHHSPTRPTMRRYLTLTGRIGAGRGRVLPPGTTVYTFYDRPVVPGMVTAVGGRATATATVLGCSVDPDFADAVRLEELLPEGCEPYDELPTAIAPGLPPPPENAESAVELAAQRLLVTLPEVPEDAIFDILSGRAPRLRGGAPLPTAHGDQAAAVTAAVAALDRSYVAVQGPPGTGKTATAARVIHRLVTRDKWRVGVVALSHPTIENLLDAVVEIGVLPELVAKKDVGAVAPEWAVIDADRYPRFLDNAVNGCVIGGAPADFADERLIPRGALDLLVIADAGYFPLAELVAVGASARNLLVVGDPATTAARAAHPAPVGASVLGGMVDAGGTLPAAFGYFLERTWRMHPRVCEPLSRVRYDGWLIANETVTLARQLDGVPPGVETVLVDHQGNTTAAEAEAREVVRRVRALLGASWTVGTLTRRLHPHDIFVVAPYGAQVTVVRTLLARAKIEDVLVGTPDRFRGREAAVVLVSMATSTAADAPDGMSALLAGDLVPAAVARAMWRAVVIRSRLLTEYLPESAGELAELAGFLELTATTGD